MKYLLKDELVFPSAPNQCFLHNKNQNVAYTVEEADVLWNSMQFAAVKLYLIGACHDYVFKVKFIFH